MKLPPPHVLLTWPTPNYDEPVTRGPAGKIIGIILALLASAVLAIRVYTRAFVSKSLGLDDILILLAHLPATAFAILCVVGEVVYGWNRHVWDVRHDLYKPGLQLSLATLTLFTATSALTKLSTLAMVDRLLANAPQRKLKMAVYLLAAVVGLDAVAFEIVIFNQCRPLSDYWTITYAPRHCIDEASHLMAAGCINTITDLLVVLLPIKIVASLQMPPRQLLIVVGLFCVSFVACVASATRVYFTWLMTISYDTTWLGWTVWVSSAIELYLGIMCASVPATKPFFASYLPSLLDSVRSSRKTTGLSTTTAATAATAATSGNNQSDGPHSNKHHARWSCISLSPYPRRQSRAGMLSPTVTEPPPSAAGLRSHRATWPTSSDDEISLVSRAGVSAGNDGPIRSPSRTHHGGGEYSIWPRSPSPSPSPLEIRDSKE